MTIRQGPIAAMAIIAAASLLGGCTPMKDRQGFLMDDELIASVKPGVDNRDSVLGTLGRPNFTGQFDQRDWYYVSRATQNYGFQRPKPVDHTVLHVRFDEAGNVVAVNRTGLDRVASITPMSDKTPTLGSKRGFFEELFGNIGAVGAPGASAPTTDNPR
jgi:outer membrane protein assembly factor BamE (lipoprotein component of BamABCDE complex)